MESKEEAFRILLDEQKPNDVEDLLKKFKRADKYRAPKKHPILHRKRYPNPPRKTGSTVHKRAPSQTHDNIQHIIKSVIKKIKGNNPQINITTDDITQYATGPAAVTLLQQVAAAFGSKYPAISASYDPVSKQVKIR